MIDSNFWKPKDNGNIASRFVMPRFSFDFKKYYKSLGIVGVVILAVVALVGTSLFFFVIKPALNVVSYANNLKADKIELEKAVKSQDLDAINTLLDKFKSDITGFRKVRDENLLWTKDFAPTRLYYQDSEHFVKAGELAVDALKEFINVVHPFADAAGFKSKQDAEVVDPNAPSGFADAFALWVKVMPEVADKMDGVIEKFDKVGDEFSYIDPNRYPENISGIPIKSNIEAARQYLTQASEYGPDIKAALTVIPPMLGVGAERRYAIIMQNDAEIRPTGGFWTNFATFRILNAALTSDFTSKDMYSLDEIIALTDTAWTSPFPKPLPPYRDFLKVEHTYARDANFSPDFVTAVDNWMWYYKKVSFIRPAEAKKINGVFALDTHVIEELLKVTGPVTVDGVTYDSNNVVLELEKIASLGLKEQQGRKKVLGDLMEAMLINMYKSESNLWPEFVETGLRLALEKHLFAYIFDSPEAQALLEKYNFAGRIRNYEDGDYSFVVSTNLGGDKANLFVTRDVDHKIYQEGSKWIHEVAVNFTYNPAQPGYDPLVKVYRDWVRVYAPQGSKLVSIEGSDATTEADTGEERGKVYFAGHITLNPNEKTAIKFKYEIPAIVVKNGSYSIYLQKQGGTSGDKHTVTFNGKTQEATLINDKTLIFK